MRSLSFVILSLFASYSWAVEIHGARFDKKTDELFLDLSYLGGCSDHQFELITAYYRKSEPPQVGARLKHTTSDTCTKPIRKEEKVKFPSVLRGGFSVELINDKNRPATRPVVSICIPECSAPKRPDSESRKFKFGK